MGKTSMQRFNVIMFLITLLNIQFSTSFDINSLARSIKVDTDNFQELCYYELKVDLIVKNYVIKIQDDVNKIFKIHKDQDRNAIKFEFFSQIFKKGSYGQIAPELSGSEDYVRSYWNYFTKKDSKTMTEKEFTKFMGLYVLEGELLVTETHPTLSEFFPNEHNISKRIGCNIAIAFWKLSSELLYRMFIEFKWSTTNQKITKTEIFTILTNTHTGKCEISMDKKCPYFTTLIGNVLGFFNMSAGNSQSLTTKETKIAYSTFLFSDVFDKKCKQLAFDAEKLQKQIKAIGFTK